MRHNKRMLIGFIVFAGVVIGIIFLGYPFILTQLEQESASSPKAQESVRLEEPIDIGNGIRLTALKEVTGNFPEDGSDEFVENMLCATFENDGENTVQYASVYVNIGEESFSFAFSTLPAGESICVYEKDKKYPEEMSGIITTATEYIAYFDEEPSVREEELEITVSDEVITVKNISDTDITQEISVFYKTFSGNSYMGGITYRFRVPAGLGSGKTYTGNAVHASEKMTKVMFVTYGN